jgi:hypothetical protein
VRLRRVKDRRKRGAAVKWELTLDHMGAAIGKNTATVYLGPAQMVALAETIAVAAGDGREEMAEQLWADLLADYERLVGEYADLGEVGPEELDESGQELVAWGEARGRAQGLAMALAVLRNPYAPDIPSIKEEAYDRWTAQEDGPAAG